MISLDFLQFDQTNLFFFIVSALGLIWERRMLPFVLVAVANLIHGTLAATLVAGLILWQQVDVGTPKWVQLKGAIGFLFIFMAAVSPEPFQQFAVCAGALMLSLSFGRGGLGVIPAVLLLRQYVPHPPEMEALLGVAAFYWIAAEGLRLSKAKQEHLIRSILETLCSLGILFGLKDMFLKVAEEPVLIGIGVGLLVFILIVTAIVHFRREAFWRVYRKTKPRLANVLTIGDKLISAKIAWVKEPSQSGSADLEQSFNRLFVLAIVSVALLAAFCVFSRGGLG